MSKTYDMITDSLQELISDYETTGGGESRARYLLHYADSGKEIHGGRCQEHPCAQSSDAIPVGKIPLREQENGRGMGIRPESTERAITPAAGAS